MEDVHHRAVELWLDGRAPIRVDVSHAVEEDQSLDVERCLECNEQCRCESMLARGRP